MVVVDSSGLDIEVAKATRQAKKVTRIILGSLAVATAFLGVALHRRNLKQAGLPDMMDGGAWDVFSFHQNVLLVLKRFPQLSLSPIVHSGRHTYTRFLVGSNAYALAQQIATGISNVHVYDKVWAARDSYRHGPVTINIVRHTEAWTPEQQFEEFGDLNSHFEGGFPGTTLHLLLYETDDKNVELLEKKSRRVPEWLHSTLYPHFKDPSVGGDHIIGRTGQTMVIVPPNLEQMQHDWQKQYRTSALTFRGFVLAAAGLALGAAFLNPLRMLSGLYDMRDAHCVRGKRWLCSRRGAGTLSQTVASMTTEQARCYLLIMTSAKAVWLVRPSGIMRSSSKEMAAAIEYYGT